MTISTDSQQEIIDAISAAQDFFMQHFEKGPVDLYNKAYSHGLKLSNAKLWIKGQALTIADLDAELLAVREDQSEPIAQIEVISGVLVNDRWMHQRLPNGWHDLFAAPPAPAVPAGFKLVPVEPTPDMMTALFLGIPDLKKGYAAMLAAAPTPTK